MEKEALQQVGRRMVWMFEQHFQQHQSQCGVIEEAVDSRVDVVICRKEKNKFQLALESRISPNARTRNGLFEDSSVKSQNKTQDFLG